MKIVHKLILLILASFVGNASISIVSFYQLENANNNMSAGMNYTLPSLNLLHYIDKYVLDSRIAIRAHVMANSTVNKENLEKRFHNDIDKALESLSKYELLISDKTDREYYDKIKSNIETYKNSSETTLLFSNENRSEDATSNIEQLSSIANQVSSSIDDSVKNNEKTARYFNAINYKNYTNSKYLLIISSSLITVFISIVGLLIYRQLNTGLQVAQKTISSIGDSLDFTLRADVHGNDEISKMLTKFNELVEKMQNNFSTILDSAENVANSAIQLQRSAERVSQGSSSQNISTSNMAASVEEITVSINHVADQAKTTRDQSNEVGLKAEKGQEVIAHTVDNIHAIAFAVDTAAQDIKQLADKGREIESVVNIIKAVAEQTNLLALNAAIEAARAGEQGRGFAVVADEVRNLAARTGTSTKEISTIIESIKSVSISAVNRMQEATAKVAQGVNGASLANEAMEEICRVATESVTLVADISNAIKEQGIATDSIAQQVENVALMVDENTRVANETTSLANNLARISDEMKRVVSAYRL